MKFKKQRHPKRNASERHEMIAAQKKYIEANSTTLHKFLNEQKEDNKKNGCLVLTVKSGNTQVTFADVDSDLFKAMSPEMKKLYNNNPFQTNVIFFTEPDEWHGYSVMPVMS